MTVTPESNLALIQELQRLVSADYQIPEGPEFSYPAVGQAVDDEMWRFITLALGNGVLDMGGRPYWLRKLATDSETNSANQMILSVSTTLGTAQAVVGGFYHRLMENIRVDLPMPLTETTYYVTLELNPLRAATAEGPISVKVYPNEPNTESGRTHLVLWKVTRKPNQLLTDATIVQVRPKITPFITVDRPENLPDAKSVLWGTRAFCHQTGEEFRAQSNQETVPDSWVSLTDPPWSEQGDTGTYKWPGHGHRRAIQRDGKKRRLRGRVTRVSGYDMYPSSGGYLVFSLSEQDYSPVEIACTVSGGIKSQAPTLGQVRVFPNSPEVRLYPAGDMTWVDLQNVEWEVK